MSATRSWAEGARRSSVVTSLAPMLWAAGLRVSASVIEPGMCDDGALTATTRRAGVARPRSEYLRIDVDAATGEGRTAQRVRLARDDDRDELAGLLLDAYRGTVDDEGEGMPEALQAADRCLARRRTDSSVVIEEEAGIVAISFVVVVRGRMYIDPVATASSWKRQGLGRRVVTASLQRLRRSGVREVGATVTDGNTASERLFGSLGFVRVGPWEP